MRIRKIYFLLIFLLASSSKVTAQKNNKVLYSSESGVLGRTETLLIPENNFYILQENYLGKLGGWSIDTLSGAGEVLKGRKFEITFTKKGANFKYLDSSGRTKKLKFEEYDKCDPFINHKRNWWYARDAYYQSDKIARAKLGDSNPEWEKRQKHKTEFLNEKGAYSNNSVFGEYCYNDFKLIVETANKAKLNFLETIIASTKN